MISRCVVLRYAVLLLLACQAVAAQAAGWTIDRLMAELSQAEPARARFVEKKTMAMLEEPVVSSGELLYQAPDRLERRTLKPRAETMIVEGDTVTMTRGSRTHTMQLQDYPQLAGIIDSIRGTLAGNRQMLERSFELKLDGTRAAWKLTLVPSEPGIARMIRVIRMEGAYDRVRSIEMEQLSGDSSLMTIEPIAEK